MCINERLNENHHHPSQFHMKRWSHEKHFILAISNFTFVNEKIQQNTDCKLVGL